jgi:alkylation response protein AidB-like acyl-CoA dehydrogenase
VGELARHRVIAAPIGNVASTLAAPTLLAHAHDDLRRELVRAIAFGEAAWCQLFSEPGSGSDLASIGTRAVRDGDEWVVSGQKVWSSAAHVADMGMLLARTDVDQPKHHGITYFALDMHQPGVEVRPLTTMSGAATFCEVFLDEVRIGADRVVGDVNDGWRVAQTTLAAERNSVAGSAVRAGLTHAASGSRGDLDRTCEEVIERSNAVSTRAGASPIRSGAIPSRAMADLATRYGVSGDPLVRQELARYFSQIKVNGWTMRRIGAAAQGLTGADGSMAKLTTSRVCQVSRDLSFRIAGADAMLAGAHSPMNGALVSVGLSSPGTRIGGGTDEVQLTVLGERALGLPREDDASRKTPYRNLRVGTQADAARRSEA